MNNNTQRGAIVLCGGHSSRMGQDKASLRFGAETMLARVVRLVGEAVDGPIVVVGAKDQTLPDLPEQTILTHDRQKDRGPLEGLAAGLSAVPEHVESVFVTACDVPLLVPAIVSRMFELLDSGKESVKESAPDGKKAGEASQDKRGYEIAVPKEDKFYHPLAAAYRTSVLPRVESLLAADRLRPFFLFEASDTLEVDVESLREVDPQLATLENLNHREDYLNALRRAGLSE